VVTPNRIITMTGAETAVHASATEQLVIITNVAIVIATLLLTWATMRDAQKTTREVVEAESKNTRLLTRLLARQTRTTNNKHRKA
jgi:hypothetical protein